jgi:hypothetical protein
MGPTAGAGFNGGNPGGGMMSPTASAGFNGGKGGLMGNNFGASGSGGSGAGLMNPEPLAGSAGNKRGAVELAGAVVKKVDGLLSDLEFDTEPNIDLPKSYVYADMALAHMKGAGKIKTDAVIVAKITFLVVKHMASLRTFCRKNGVCEVNTPSMMINQLHGMGPAPPAKELSVMCDWWTRVKRT